jgi:hypothetical protein
MTHQCSLDARVHVDHRNRFFLTILKPLRNAMSPGMSVIQTTTGVPTLQYGSRKPFFVHGNGQTNMGDLVVALGYTLTPTHRRDIDAYLRKTTFAKVFVYVPRLKTHILVCALAIVCLTVLWRRSAR